MEDAGDPDQVLAAAIADRAEAARRSRRLADAETAREEATAALAAARSALVREETDVERLEHLSWSRIVSALRGDHLDRLERERAERDAARYREREASVRHAQAETEVEAARSSLADLGDTEAGYRTALDAKEDWLAGRDPQLAAQLGAWARRRGDLEAERRESAEADHAGVTAHQRLAAAARLLSSAEGWSAWDTFMGGGLIADAIKYRRIDAVMAELRQAAAALKAFRIELADLDRIGAPQLEIGPLLSAFDVVFDNVFSDWAVLRRIQNAHRQVIGAAAEVEGIVGTLRSRRAVIDTELADLERQRAALLGTPDPR